MDRKEITLKFCSSYMKNIGTRGEIRKKQSCAGEANKEKTWENERQI